MQFRLLGPLEITNATGTPSLGGLRARAALGYLLLHVNEVVGASQLIDAVWGNEPPASARKMLHMTVSALRRVLDGSDGPESARLVTQPPGYSLRAPASSVDVHVFENLAREGHDALAATEWSTAADLFGRALACWRGPALADLVEAGLDWPEIAGLQESRLLALEGYFDANLACGRHRDVGGELEALTRQEPLRERFHAQLMIALYRCGRQADALAAYRRIRATLVGDLGVEPGAELRGLERAVLTQDSSLDEPGAQQSPTGASPSARSRTEATADVPIAPTARPAVGGDQIASMMERRRVTVLIAQADAGSMAAAPDPEDAHEALASLCSMVRTMAGGYGGEFHGVVGSMVLCAFGATHVCENDAERAVRTAFAIRDVGDPVHRLRLAVATGECVVAMNDGQGEPDRPVLTGAVVDECMGLLVGTAAQQITVCETTMRASAGAIDYTAGGAGTWRAVTPRVSPPPCDGPMVDRDREVRLLTDVLDQALGRRRPHLVTLVGEPGIGKSRLASELCQIAASRSGTTAVALGRTQPFGGRQWGALAQIFHALIGVSDDAPEAATRDAVIAAVGGVSTNVEQATWLVAGLETLLTNGSASPRTPKELFPAWRCFLEELAQLRGLVLVLEDIHWAEDALLDFVEDLYEHVDDVPLLVLATARPEFLERRPGWGGGRRNTVTMTVDPLTDLGTRQLLRLLLSRHGLANPAPDGVAAPGAGGGPDLELPVPTFDATLTMADLVDRVGGNPLFAEEYVRMLRDDGSAWPVPSRPGSMAQQQATELDGKRDEAELAPPEFVRAVITARIDLLPAAERMLLYDAAVLGPTVWVAALAAVGGRDVAEVNEAIDSLRRRDFLKRARSRSLAGQPAYRFGHMLIRDIAYARISRADRADRHARVAAWFEQLPIEHAHSLAYHYSQALELAPAGRDVAALAERARVALARMGDRANAVGALEASMRSYQAAVRFCPPDHPTRPTLLLRYGCSQVRCSSNGADELREAAALLLADGDPVGAAEAHASLAGLAMKNCDRVERDRHLDATLELCSTAAPNPRSAAVLANAAKLMAIVGRYEQAIEAAEQALACADDLPTLATVAALQAIGIARVDSGDARGLVAMEQAVKACLSGGVSPAVAYGNLAVTLAKLGELSRRPDILADGIRSAERYRDTTLLSWLNSETTLDHYWAGRWILAHDSARRVLGADNTASLAPPQHVVLGRIALSRRDLDAARHHAERALSPNGDMQHMSVALIHNATVMIETGEPDRARKIVDEFLGLLDGEALAPDIGIDLPLALLALEYPADSLRHVTPTRWLDAAEALLRGDPLVAADQYATVGSRPDEARARLEAARLHAAEGEFAAADRQLDEVAAFATSVAATGLARCVDEVRARSSSGARSRKPLKQADNERAQNARYERHAGV